MPSILFSRDDADKPPAEHHSSGPPGWAIFLIVILIMALIGGGVFLFFRSRNNRTDGPTSSPVDTAKSWLSKATYKIRNPRDRSASAGFEGISAGRAGSGRGARNRSALDPDEAWDTRVGNEADYPGYYGEDTELQGGILSDGRYESLGHASTEYGGAAGTRGRVPAENPFGDENAADLRSVSPRPDGGHAAPRQHSPARRSLFKEDV